jgi:hypothetical protein
MTRTADGGARAAPRGRGGKLITCFLPKGKALEVAELLHDRKNIVTCDFTSGRGRGLVKSVSYGRWVEMDILSIIVTAVEAEDIFEFIYHEAGIGHYRGGFIFQIDLLRSTSFTLPAVPEEA